MRSRSTELHALPTPRHRALTWNEALLTMRDILTDPAIYTGSVTSERACGSVCATDSIGGDFVEFMRDSRALAESRRGTVTCEFALRRNRCSVELMRDMRTVAIDAPEPDLREQIADIVDKATARMVDDGPNDDKSIGEEPITLIGWDIGGIADPAILAESVRRMIDMTREMGDDVEIHLDVRDETENRDSAEKAEEIGALIDGIDGNESISNIVISTEIDGNHLEETIEIDRESNETRIRLTSDDINGTAVTRLIRVLPDLMYMVEKPDTETSRD